MKLLSLSLLLVFPPIYGLQDKVINARDDKGNTSLHYAVQKHDDCAVESLVLAGANIDIENNDGLTPLDLARDYCLFTYEDKENYLNNMDIYLFLFKNSLHRFKVSLDSMICEYSDNTLEVSECDLFTACECEDCEFCEEDGK